MKRWLRRTVVAVLIALVVRTVWVLGEREVVRAEGEREYAASVAEADAADPDWRWSDLAAKRPRPPAGRNGMDVVMRARAALPADWAAAGADDAPLAEPPDPANVRLPARVAAAARGRLAAAAEGVAVARTLKDYPQGYYPLVLEPKPWETKLPHIDAVRRVLVFLRWDGALAADAGNAAAALDSAEAMLNLSRMIGDEPFLISQLVRISVRVHAVRELEHLLGQTEPDPARLAALQAAWTTEAEEPLLLHGVRGERAINDVMFENLLNGTIRQADIDRGTGSPDGWFGRYSWWLYKTRFWRDRAALHAYLTRAVAATRLPVHEQPAAVAALPPPPLEELKLAALFTPAVEKCAAAGWRSAAQCRCVAVALACERYRRAHNRWPDALSDLSPTFLPAVPLDPFDGRPLRYRRLPDGVVVYSIGTNRLDDEGNTARPADGSVIAPDEGIRLWDTAARHLSPAGG